MDESDSMKVCASQQSSNSHLDSETWELPGRSPSRSPVHSSDHKGSPPYSSDDDDDGSEEDRVGFCILNFGWVLHLKFYCDLC